MTVRIARLSTALPDFDAQLQRVLHWSGETDRSIEDAAARIISERDLAYGLAKTAYKL